MWNIAAKQEGDLMTDGHRAIRGIIPPTTTVFGADGELYEAGIRAQIRFLLDAGVHGIAAAGSTGEGHTLDHDEFVRVMEVTVDEVGGRVPVIAGIIVDSTRDAIRRAKSISHLDVAALQVTPVHYLFRPSDDAMVEHFRTIAQEAGKPILIYNVVPWVYLSAELLCRIFREVPGVMGVKQSAGDLRRVADLLLITEPQDVVFTAVDALLYPSFMLGAHGVIAALPTAVPHLAVDLWNACQNGDHGRAKELHLKLLRVWRALESDNLPACTKYALTLQGCPSGLPRAPMHPPSDAQKKGIREALIDIGLAVEG